MSDLQEKKYMELIQNHEGVIHKVIGLYVDEAEDRRDLYQEVLLQGWKSFQNFRGDAQFSTWLYKVCLNTVLTFRKKADRQPKVELKIDPQTPETPPPKEESELLYYLIRRLDEVDRMLMTLHLDGYKNKEIAEITGMTGNHVNVKIHRLKNQIIENFKKLNHGY